MWWRSPEHSVPITPCFISNTPHVQLKEELWCGFLQLRFLRDFWVPEESLSARISRALIAGISQSALISKSFQWPGEWCEVHYHWRRFWVGAWKCHLTFAARINHPQALPATGLPHLLFKTSVRQTPQSRQPAPVLHHPTIKNPYLT